MGENPTGDATGELSEPGVAVAANTKGGFVFSASSAFHRTIFATQLIALFWTGPYLHNPVTEVAQSEPRDRGYR
jgi:hypothetical protein